MKSYLQFVTVPTGDTPGTCLMLHYDNRRYLLGHLGEGTMRACNELGLSLRKVQKILLSGRTTRETTGGLLGMLLTLADANQAAADNLKDAKKKNRELSFKVLDNEDVNVYGPPNLVHSVAAARKFIFRKNTPTTIRDLEDTAPEVDEHGEWLPRIVDSNVDVFPLVIRPGHRNTNERTPQEQSDDVVRQRIIDDMFNSKWRLDTLVEKYLHEVPLPAKIWVREPGSSDKGLHPYNGPLPPDPAANRFLKVFVRNPWPAAQIARLPETKPKPDAVSYIVRGRMLRGRFDMEKAKKFGIPKGPLFSELANGREITLENGTIVKPEQVLGPDIQAGGFAIFDLPSEEYVEPLLAREELVRRRLQDGVNTCIWILGPNVLKNTALQNFIRDKTQHQHIISSPDYHPDKLVAHAAATSAIKLAQVDREHFPVPYFDNATVPAPNFRREAGVLPLEVDKLEGLFAQKNVRLAERGLMVQLDPKQVVDEKSITPDLDTVSLITTPQSQEVVSLAKEVKQSATDGPLKEELKAWRTFLGGADTEIITLGTGSAMPSRYRNVSATLVRVPGWGSYLLDAGENTLGQLQRVFKPQELVEVLRDLRMIWISHGHADHHLGTVSIIKAWHDVVHGKNNSYPPLTRSVAETLMEELRNGTGGDYDPPALENRPKYLAVMGNRFLIDYLQEMSQCEDFGFSHVLPLVAQENGNLHHNINTPGATSTIVSILLMNTGDGPWLSGALNKTARVNLLGVVDVRAVSVAHCNGARALYLRFPGSAKFSVAYSGDCRPSSAFAAAAKGATVLIHEATFDDELKFEAQAKKHSTVQEAIGVAGLMEAKSLVLTHFSQRYQKIPVLDDIWGRQEEVQKKIKSEEEKGSIKGPGAGEDVDEISGDTDELPTSFMDTSGMNENGQAEDDASDAEGEAESTKMDVENGEQKKVEMPILFAFDYMRVKVADMPMLKAYRPALTKLFEKEIGELQDIKEKREERANLVNAGLATANGAVKRSGSRASLMAGGRKRRSISGGKVDSG